VLSEPLARFVDRCRSAARWRESLATRHQDAGSSRAAHALREVALWAATDAQAEKYLELDLRDLYLVSDWTESQEYQFTTFCLEEVETRAHWLARVVEGDP